MSEIICPSGLSGEIRGLKLGDLDTFLDKSLRNKPGPVFEFALANKVWQRTTARGPYVYEGIMPPWEGDVLTGDRFYTILQARILARGPLFEFEVLCENSICEKIYTWEVNLRELPVKNLSEKSCALFTAGNKFDTLLPCGQTATWQLPTGRSQKRADELMREHGRSISVAYASRLLDVSGVDRRKFVDWMKDLDIVDSDALMEAMEEADCGVETSIETTCPHCEFQQTTEMPMGRGFFSRDRTAEKRKKTKSTGTYS